MRKYEPRLGEMRLALNTTAPYYREIVKGERFTIKDGSDEAAFTVEDVSEPDAHGTITVTFTEAR